MKTKQLSQGWKKVELGEMIKLKGGYAFKSSGFVKEGVPIIRIANFNNNFVNISKTVKYPSQKIEDYSEYTLEENDLLIAMSGATTGKIGIVSKQCLPCLLNQRVGKFDILDGKKLNWKFLLFIIKSNSFQKEVYEIASGCAQPNISGKQIESIKIPLPPLPTQKKIVQILEQAEQLKQKREQADKLMDDYLKSVFSEMFGDLVRNEKNWPIRKLLEITKEMQPGFAYGKFNEEGGLIHLRPFNINNQGYLLFDQIKYIPTTEINSEKYFLLKGDVVINTTNSKELVGKTTLFNIDEECSFSNHMTKIRVDNSLLNPYYLWFTLNRYWDAGLFRPLIKSWVNQVGIDSALLKSLKIPLPTLSLQQKFASIVEKVEKIKEAQKKSKQEIGDLFNALMQKAFEGELVR